MYVYIGIYIINMIYKYITSCKYINTYMHAYMHSSIHPYNACIHILSYVQFMHQLLLLRSIQPPVVSHRPAGRSSHTSTKEAEAPPVVTFVAEGFDAENER
jgi:hypothetical protein